MKYVGMTVAFVLVAACAAGQQNLAPSAGATTEQVAVQKKPESKGRVCRRVESTGSIMRQSICKTEEQWAAEDKAARDEAARIQNSQRNASQAQ